MVNLIRNLITQTIDIASFITGMNKPDIWETGWIHHTARQLND